MWEAIEYTAEAVVIIGCLFEGLADFEFILKGHENDKKRQRVERAAFLVLIVGLALGLTALVRTNQLFTDTISVLYGEARDANDRAAAASNKATLAQDRAEVADRELIRLRTPRFLSLTKEARERIRQRLAQFTIRSVWVTFQSGVFDAPELARQLGPLLGTDGLGVVAEDNKETVPLYMLDTPLDPYVSGVEVIYLTGWSGQKLTLDLAANKRLAEAISRALVAEGIDTRAKPEVLNFAPGMDALLVSDRKRAMGYLNRIIVRVGAIPSEPPAIQKSASAAIP